MDVIFSPTPSRGSRKRSKPVVDTIVVHYSGRRNPTSAYNTILNPKEQKSYHFLIGPDAESIWCFVPVPYVAWHAGHSLWKGRRGLNRYSIGISFANDGTQGYNEKEMEAFYELLFDGYHLCADPNIETHAEYDQWLGPQQAILHEYPHIGVDNIVGHDFIAQNAIEAGIRPEWNGRSDPGALFPWDQVYAEMANFRSSQLKAASNHVASIQKPRMEFQIADPEKGTVGDYFLRGKDIDIVTG
jgi:N-acetylmuramoyl-L-alanine amidase